MAVGGRREIALREGDRWREGRKCSVVLRPTDPLDNAPPPGSLTFRTREIRVGTILSTLPRFSTRVKDRPIARGLPRSRAFVTPAVRIADNINRSTDATEMRSYQKT